MKKFKFKLQKVQDTKETQVKQKSGELSKLSYQKATKVQELEDLHGELSMIQREIYEKTMGGCPVHEVLDSHKYADKITQQIKQTRKQIEQLDEKIERRQVELLQLNKEEKILEKLREKRYLQYLQQQNKEEQKILDETFLLTREFRRVI